MANRTELQKRDFLLIDLLHVLFRPNIEAVTEGKYQREYRETSHTRAVWLPLLFIFTFIQICLAALQSVGCFIHWSRSKKDKTNNSVENKMTHKSTPFALLYDIIPIFTYCQLLIIPIVYFNIDFWTNLLLYVDIVILTCSNCPNVN